MLILILFSCVSNSQDQSKKQTDTSSIAIVVSVPKPTITPVPTRVPRMKPNIPTPILPPTPIITDIFDSQNTYDRFDSILKLGFKEIADKEFTSIEQKAGISIAVYTNNKIWRYATGVADTSRIMTIETPILIGSTSKTFMSALILNQIDNELYKVTDSIEFLLSQHPEYISFDKDKINPKVTIEELLSMTSGLPDYNENRDGLSEFFKIPFWKPSDNILLAQSNFVEPGTFVYTDTNVVLLGLIAELYGKKPLNELYRDAFFTPLQISALVLSYDGTPTHTARPYDNLTPWSSGFGNMIEAAPFTFDHYIFGQGRIRWACCGIISTPEYLARWGYELYSSNGSAISSYSRKLLLNSFRDEKVSFAGTKQYYGYLVSKREFPISNSESVISYGHPGGGGGYSTLLRYSPELDLSIAILANSPLKFQGSCKDYDPKACIASSIFKKYQQFLVSEK